MKFDYIKISVCVCVPVGVCMLVYDREGKEQIEGTRIKMWYRWILEQNEMNGKLCSYKNQNIFNIFFKHGE